MNMGSEPKYIKDRGYDVEDEFLDTLEEVDRDLAIQISLYIEDNVTDVSPNELTTYVLGGIIHKDNDPITFAVEVLKQKGAFVTLTDLSFISMDEYLDLININSYIKPNN